jgi:hypothetical protein
MLVALWPVFCDAAYCSSDGADAWYREPEPEVWPRLYDMQNRAKFVAKVIDAQQQHAKQRLLEVPFVAISSHDAETLTGGPVLPSSDNYFLLRGLAYDWPGNFVVAEDAGDVVVSYGFLGNPPGSAKKTAIVALLRRKPAEVFVNCGGAL